MGITGHRSARRRLRVVTICLPVLSCLVVAAGLSAPSAGAASPASGALVAPYTGLTILESGSDVLDKEVTRAADASDGPVSVTGAGDNWVITFTPAQGSPIGIRVWDTHPLGVGVPDAVAVLSAEGQLCASDPGDVDITQWQVDPGDGQPTAIAVDVLGVCRTQRASSPHVKAHLRLRAATPYGGLDVAAGPTDFGTPTVGEGGPSETTTYRYVGAGSMTVATATFVPVRPDEFSPADFLIASDSCTGRVLRRGRTCAVTARGRMRYGTTDSNAALRLTSSTGLTVASTSAVLRDGGVDQGGDILDVEGRAWDTRTAYGSAPPTPVPPGGILSFPANAVHVPIDQVEGGTALVNLTAINARSAGHLDTLAPGASSSATSSLNFQAGQTIANLVLAPIDSLGHVRVKNVSGSPLDLVADIEGVVRPEGVCPDGEVCGGRLHPVPPSRILDTRTAAGGARPIPSGASIITAQLGVTYGMDVGFLATVTVVSPSASGWLLVGGDTTGSASSVTYTRGQTVSNTVLVHGYRFSGTGPTSVTIVDHGPPVHVVIDATAVLDGGYDPSGVSLIAPPGGAVRIADSRMGLGLSTLSGGAAGSLLVPAALRGPDVVGVVQNLVAIPPGPTYLVSYPTGAARPPTAGLVTSVAGPRAATMLTMLSDAGSMDLFASQGPTDVVSDVAATVRLFPTTEQLQGFDRLPVDAPAIPPVTRSP